MLLKTIFLYKNSLQVGWFPEAYAEPASNPVKADDEKPAEVVAEKKESNQYVALFPYNSEGLLFFYF